MKIDRSKTLPSQVDQNFLPDRPSMNMDSLNFDLQSTADNKSGSNNTYIKKEKSVQYINVES